MSVAGHRTSVAGHRTSVAGHRTSVAGHLKSFTSYSHPTAIEGFQTQVAGQEIHHRQHRLWVSLVGTPMAGIEVGAAEAWKPVSGQPQPSPFSMHSPLLLSPCPAAKGDTAARGSKREGWESGGERQGAILASERQAADRVRVMDNCILYEGLPYRAALR